MKLHPSSLQIWLGAEFTLSEFSTIASAFYLQTEAATKFFCEIKNNHFINFKKITLPYSYHYLALMSISFSFCVALVHWCFGFVNL
jgi:hypothetical protein